MAANDNGPCPLSPYHISHQLTEQGVTYFVCTRMSPSGANDIYGPDDFETVQKITRFLNENTKAYRPTRLPHVLRTLIQLALDEDTPLSRFLLETDTRGIRVSK